ncbi:hypothetical protein DFS34DRAFT_597422 [Phlyctochytrium arcticum]|nr:hypothetical protein DFS34DRAFT_597422 [Phlyctochytrium arcticum]
MYAYSIATKAGSQEDFYVIGSDDNPMKCALDLQPVMDNIAAFLTEIDYPDKEGIFHNSFVLAGDFYVWMYASKLLRSPRYKHLEAHVLPVPDIMHVALNAQEAVLVHAWTIIHSLWLAGYPDVENTTPINMRPKRRTAMLALAMTAWQECRQELLAAYKKSAASNPEATTVRKAMVDTLIAVFEEYIPIAVDCPYLLASGDLLQIKLCLTRLFPLFALLGKKNYVNIILFQLGLLEKLPSLLPNDIAMAFLFSKFSSEDLEVFHSILRAAIRYQDTNDQVSRKAMLITAMRGESAVKQLAAMTAREKAIREQAASPIKKETRPSAPSPLEKASEDVVPRMVVFLKSLFTSLFTFSFDVVGQHGKTPYTSDVPHYKLIQRPLPSSQPVTSAEEFPEVILATIRESLVPLQLRRQTFVNLGNHVDVESFQTVPLPIAKNPLGDITNLPSPSSKTTKKPVRDFLSTTSLEYDLARCGWFALACQCSAMYQSIGTTSLEHFLKNIDKDVPRDSEGKPDNDVFRAVSLAGGRSTSHRFLHPI